jgi:hypothetical protein
MRDMIKSEVYAICSYFALLIVFAKAIDKIDPTSGKSAKPKVENDIRPMLFSRYCVTLR